MITSQVAQQINIRDQSDAVGKLRVSQPQALIDTDFEYGLQGTKWETLELVNGWPSAGYRPSEPAFVGNSGASGILSIVGSPNQVGALFGGFAPNGTMRVTVLTPPVNPFVALNPITVKFTGITPSSYSDSTDGSGVITRVINLSTFEYKSNTNTLQSISVNVATENTIIYTGQWLSNSLIPVNKLVTYGGSCSAGISLNTPAGTSVTHGFFPGIQFSLISPISTNDVRYPWCGNFSVDGLPGIDLTNSLQNTYSVCFYTASSYSGATRTIVSSNTDGLSCVVNSSGYVSHRFMDGGVQINCSSPYSFYSTVTANLASINNIPRESRIIRQTRKYFRYQSGKSIQFSTGITFRPVLDPSTWGSIGSSTIDGITRYTLSLTFDFDHGMVGYCAPYGPSSNSRIPYKNPSRIKMSGWASEASPVAATASLSAFPLLNGVFDVLNATDSNVLTVDLGTNPAFGQSPYFGVNPLGIPRIEPVGWYDATVRTGLFDDQNGMFWEYDGTNVNVVRRNSVQQLPGKYRVDLRGTDITNTTFGGGATRLTNATNAGDTINIKGQSHYLMPANQQTDATNRTFYPWYRGPSVTGWSARVSRINETRIKQSQFNLDKLDGTGPSGYILDPGKMQMVFIDYSWYGAGKIRFGMRANDGNIVWCHEMTNNNVNTEAYMKTGNLPARFELSTRSRPFETLVSPTFQLGGSNSINILTPNTYFLSAYAADSEYLPASGSLFYNNEVVNYMKTKSSTQFVELSVTNRWQPGGQSRTAPFQITSPVFGGSMQPNDRAFSINQNCSPTVSHWGTSVIMDGDFNTDKSYLFTAAALSATVVPVGAEYPLISIRLAPSADYGIPANFGVRSQITRAQLTLDSLGAAVAGQAQIVLRINPQTTVFAQKLSGWTNVAGGSLAQYFDHSQQEAGGRVSYVGGELIGAFYANQTQSLGTNYEVTSINIASTRELGNSILGGDLNHPDGPDILTVSIKNISTVNAILTGFARITWTESQG